MLIIDYLAGRIIPAIKDQNFFTFDFRYVSTQFSAVYKRCFFPVSFQNILDKFNPGARQLINAGKAYLKALHGE